MLIICRCESSDYFLGASVKSRGIYSTLPDTDWSMAPKPYLHEVSLWVEHAGAKGDVGVVERDNVKNNSLGHCQYARQHPYYYDLDEGEERDAHPLHSAPGRHSPVPVKKEVKSGTFSSVHAQLILKVSVEN